MSLYVLKYNPKLVTIQYYSEVPLPYPVEESILHHQCKTGSFSNTVFDVPPVTSSITSFVKLTVVTPKPVLNKNLGR